MNRRPEIASELRKEILRILSLYRLSFGQPRQQELIENLLRRQYSDADLAEIRRAKLIDLAPVNYVARRHPDLVVLEVRSILAQ